MIILENTKEYKDTKLAIPVGVGVVQTESVKNFYNTSDADATSADILINKTAYGKYGKLTGTLDLDAEKEISYQDGYETGRVDGYDSGYSIGYEGGYNAGETEQKSKLTSITITENGSYTREDGYNEVVVEVPDLNGDYNEGYTDGETAGYSDGYAEGLDDGIIDGRNQIIEEQSDANITANDVTLGKIGYGANNEKIVGTSEAITSIKLADYGMKFQGSSITTIPSIFDLSGYTSLNDMFKDCNKLTSISELDTSKVTSMSGTFWGCSKLQHIPFLDTSKVKNMYTTFYACPMTTYQEFDLSSLDGTAYNAIYPFYTTTAPENLGGFKDVGKGYIARTNYGDILLQSQSNLTYESCMNVINKVYDLNLNTIYNGSPKIRFHATPYALLSADDIAIATVKGWTVQAG